MIRHLPPSRYRFPDPRDAEGDLVAVGGDLAPSTILGAYRQGLFPMPTDHQLGWWSPLDRAIIEFSDLRISRSLSRSCRRFTVVENQSFEDVISECAHVRRPGGWITPAFIDAYTDLHNLGWAHSIEVHDRDGELVGGLYGVQIGGFFAGESMYHRVSDASKVALVHLVGRLAESGGHLLDVQWQTDHLRVMGASVIGRDAYLDRLAEALQGGPVFGETSLGPVPSAPVIPEKGEN
ncbi:MAG: leucyl/phenylalanyl-tRNA--protein transferase [Acidimicrobiia bacterium]|nr:leucyl/phenylalanyl-tRNA--protein transferase [Acidimicrobiia bacterium]